MVLWLLVRVALYAAVVIILSEYYWPDPPPPDDGSRDGIVYEIVEVMTAFVLIIVTGAMVALGELAAHLHRDRRRRLAAERGWSPTQWRRTRGSAGLSALRGLTAREPQSRQGPPG